MKLYFDPISTTSRPVALLVAEADIEVEMHAMCIRSGDQHRPAFLSINPKGLVPALVVDSDFVLTESAAILKYLAVHHAPQFYSQDARKQARIDEMLAWFGSDVHLFLDVFTVYPQTLLAGVFTPAACEELAGVARPVLDRHFDAFERRLRAQDFAAGDEISIADFLGISFMTLADMVRFDFSRWPAIHSWMERMRALRGWSASFGQFEHLLQSAAGPSATET